MVYLDLIHFIHFLMFELGNRLCLILYCKVAIARQPFDASMKTGENWGSHWMSLFLTVNHGLKQFDQKTPRFVWKITCECICSHLPQPVCLDVLSGQRPSCKNDTWTVQQVTCYMLCATWYHDRFGWDFQVVILDSGCLCTTWWCQQFTGPVCLACDLSKMERSRGPQQGNHYSQTCRRWSIFRKNLVHVITCRS